MPIPQFLRDFIDPKVNLWEAALALVVAAPLTEEALFRGVILRGFLTRHSVTTSIAVSAVMFGAVHGNLWQLLPAIGFGFMAGWWRVRSGSLIPAVYAHALGKGFPLVAGRVFH